MLLSQGTGIVDSIRKIFARTFEIVHPMARRPRQRPEIHGADQVIDTFTNTYWQSDRGDADADGDLRVGGRPRRGLRLLGTANGFVPRSGRPPVSSSSSPTALETADHVDDPRRTGHIDASNGSSKQLKVLATAGADGNAGRPFRDRVLHEAVTGIPGGRQLDRIASDSCRSRLAAPTSPAAWRASINSRHSGSWYRSIPSPARQASIAVLGAPSSSAIGPRARLDGRRAVVLARLDHPLGRALLGQEVAAVQAHRRGQRLGHVAAPAAGQAGLADRPIELAHVDGLRVDGEAVGIALARDEPGAVGAQRLDEHAADGRHGDLEAAGGRAGVGLGHSAAAMTSRWTADPAWTARSRSSDRARGLIPSSERSRPSVVTANPPSVRNRGPDRPRPRPRRSRAARARSCPVPRPRGDRVGRPVAARGPVRRTRSGAHGDEPRRAARTAGGGPTSPVSSWTDASSVSYSPRRAASISRIAR